MDLRKMLFRNQINVFWRILLQATFTREECIKLTKLIESEAVDFPASKGLDGARTNEISSRVKSWSALSSPTFRAHTPDIAVMEAKKWIQEKSLVKTKTLGTILGMKALQYTWQNHTCHLDLLGLLPHPLSLDLEPHHLLVPFILMIKTQRPVIYWHLLRGLLSPLGQKIQPMAFGKVAGSESLAVTSGINVPNEDAIILSDHNVRIENSVVHGVNSSLAPRQEGFHGELNTRLPFDNCRENVVKLCESLASGQNIAGSVLLESNSISLYGNGSASHIPIVPDKSEERYQWLRNVNKRSQLLRMPRHSFQASAAPLTELYNQGGHISSSSHRQGDLAVSNSEGSHDVLSEASASLVDKSNATGKTDLVGESDAVEVLPHNKKGNSCRTGSTKCD